MTALKMIHDRAFVNGTWCVAQGGRSFAVTNPATGAHLASVPDMGPGDADAAIIAAAAAYPAWKGLLAKDRAKILRAWFDLIVKNADDLAALLTAEQGKPLAEARGEIIYGANFIEWYAEESKRVYGDTIPAHKTDARIIVTREPVGVVTAITPWNFPSAMITRKVAPALAAGCTVVIKPAEDTPLSALALAQLAEQAGMPPGVLNVVTCSLESAPALGRVLTTHPLVKKISFTGSTEVGKILMAQAAGTVKKVSLELGGNAPFIVFESADIDRAVDGAIICKFRNAGQTCVCANRIFVHEKIYDTFAEKLTAKVRALKIAPGDQPGAQVGPLINAAAVAKVRDHVADAVAHGGKILTGGAGHDAGPLFFDPTVITGVTPDAKIFREETFGPVAGLFRFRDEADVIAQANDTPFGLAAYFYTAALAQAFRVAEALEYGMVAINEPILSTEAAPFGGIKESGIGREGSKYGIDDYLTLKYTLVGGLSG